MGLTTDLNAVVGPFVLKQPVAIDSIRIQPAALTVDNRREAGSGSSGWPLFRHG